MLLGPLNPEGQGSRGKVVLTCSVCCAVHCQGQQAALPQLPSRVAALLPRDQLHAALEALQEVGAASAFSLFLLHTLRSCTSIEKQV